MTNHAARLPLSIGPEAGWFVVGFACAVAASLGAPAAALAAQVPSPAPLTSPGAAPASSGAALPRQGGAPPSQGSAQAPSAPSATSQEGAEKRRRIERATALHDEAQGLYQHGEYRAAIARLEAAVALDPEGKELIYNLAVIHERLGEIEQAERYYRRYLEMEALPKEREEVAAVLKRLQGAKRELSSARPPPPAPAPARSAEASAALPYLPRLPRRSGAAGSGRPHGPWLYVSGGIAAGSLVVGGVFAALAVARDPGSSRRTGGGVSVADLQADASAAHRCAVAADVALLVAGLSGAAALYLYLSPRAPAASPRAARPVSAALSGTAIPGRDGGAPSLGASAAEDEPRVGLSLVAGGARLQVQF
ncbi:tetratricopeptide repeat protein [Sorangium sp. So ce1078]|uniref:tetratricopeptide repeat protein n=1 Tax=Sorangium sp. So ce1078 TaxID=3133329 RepID=UPI003F5D9541